VPESSPNNAAATVDEEEENEAESVPDPRAALNAMFAKRNQPPSDEPESSLNDVDAAATVDEEEENETESIPDPRAALNAMFAKRNQAQSESSLNDVGAAVKEKEIITESVPNPRAALNAMFAKRNKSPLAAPESVKEVKPSVAVGSDIENVKLESNPHDALMTMLSKRNSSPVDCTNMDAPTGSCSEPLRKGDVSPKLVKQEEYPSDEAVQPDPIAALMAMISNRKSLPVNDLQKNSADCDDEKKEENLVKTDDTDTIVVSKTLIKENGKAHNSRSALMSMLNKQETESISTEQKFAQHSALNDNEPPLNKDPKYEKYFRMLKMVRVAILLIHDFLHFIHKLIFYSRACLWAQFKMPCKGMAWTHLSWTWTTTSQLPVSKRKKTTRMGLR
jgi:hypothetical protein